MEDIGKGCPYWRSQLPILDAEPGRAEGVPVANGLHVSEILASGTAPGQFAETDAGFDGLALGPLVAPNPYLGRVREPAAFLEEPGAEIAKEYGRSTGPSRPSATPPTRPTGARSPDS
jgi:hypothetical protein